jgi:small Trp-rich protein
MTRRLGAGRGAALQWGRSQRERRHGGTPIANASLAKSGGVIMPLLVVGIALAVLRFFEFGPFAKLSWWWVALPFVLVVIWWEVIVPMFHLDKRKEHAEFDAERKKRMERNRSGRANF